MSSPLSLLNKDPVIQEQFGKGITVLIVFYEVRVVSKRSVRLTIYVIFTQQIMFIDYIKRGVCVLFEEEAEGLNIMTNLNSTLYTCFPSGRNQCFKYCCKVDVKFMSQKCHNTKDCQTRHISE
jgi:hypothetical protein